MSPEENDLLDRLFFALSDRTRRGVLEKLSQKEASVTELAEAYSMTLAGMMKHLGVLARANLVQMEKDGRVRICSFNPQGLSGAAKYIDEYKVFWTEQFDRIESFLKK